MALAASNARNAAAAALRESIRDLRRCKDGANPSPRLLKTKYEKLQSDKTDLFNKHCIHAEKSDLDLESEELTQWIEPKMDDASLLLDEVFLILEKFSDDELTAQKNNETALEDTKAKQDIRIAELQCATDEKNLRESVDAMRLFIDDGDHSSKEHASAAHTHLMQVDESLRELTKSWNVLKRLPGISEQSLNNVFQAEETVKKLVAKEKQDVFAFISRVDPESSVAIKSSASSEAGGSKKEFDSNQLKSERIKNPKFSGDIRAFANFKADFQKIVASKYSDKTHQAYVMKQSCLVGECKKLVENMNDIDKIWERLEMRYGDSTEIVNVIVQGLESFKFTKNNHDIDMIGLVDQLEKGLQDLTAINSEHEISNAFTVTLLERKIPRHVFNRWTEKELDDDSGEDSDSSAKSKGNLSKFGKLYKFLLKERKKSERALLLRDRIDRSNPPPPLASKKHLGAGAFQSQGQNNRTVNHNNKCIVHPSAGHLTRKCNTFLSKTVEERGSLVKAANGCKLCLSSSHTGQPCPFLSTWQKCGVGGCQEPHSRLLHGYTLISTFHISVQFGDASPLLLMQRVDTPQGSIVAFWDNGSTLALISRQCARRNNLIGVSVMCELLTVGGIVTVMQTILYEVDLIDRNDEIHKIKMYEIEDICGKVEAANTDSLTQFFPSISEEDISRPVGAVDVLIGMENADIHPHQIEWNQGLVLYQSKFGTGKIIGGMNKGISSGDHINAKVRQCAQAKISNIRILKAPSKPRIDFFSSEQFGVSPSRRCERCKGCKNCAYETEELSQDAKIVLDRIL